MTRHQRIRIFFLVVKELSSKYTKALFGGFIAGLTLSLLFWRLNPILRDYWFIPVERIGIVGEFTPNTLPPSIQNQISYGLTRLNDDGSVGPGLATSWEATDSGKIFTFHLKDNVKWHNGMTTVASDVNYNIKNVTFSVLDDKTVRVLLPSPYSPLPSLLSKPLFLSGLVGLGEYKVSGIRLNGDAVTYLKIVSVEKSNKRAKEYRFFATEKNAVTAYKLGEIDQIFDLSSPYGLNSWKNTKVEATVKTNRIVSLFFNMSQDPLSDKDIRHGLAYALPQFDENPAFSPISKTSWAYTDKVKKYTPNPDEAKNLLAGISTATDSPTLHLTTFSAYADTARKIVQSWSSAGLKVDLKIVNAVTPDYQILLSAQELPPDPDQYPFWHSTQSLTNITHLSNVKIDKLLEDGRQLIDTKERIKIYGDFQRRIIDEAPAIFLYYPTVYSAKRT